MQGNLNAGLLARRLLCLAASSLCSCAAASGRRGLPTRRLARRSARIPLHRAQRACARQLQREGWHASATWTAVTLLVEDRYTITGGSKECYQREQPTFLRR